MKVTCACDPLGMPDPREAVMGPHRASETAAPEDAEVKAIGDVIKTAQEARHVEAVVDEALQSFQTRPASGLMLVGAAIAVATVIATLLRPSHVRHSDVVAMLVTAVAFCVVGATLAGVNSRQAADVGTAALAPLPPVSPGRAAAIAQGIRDVGTPESDHEGGLGASSTAGGDALSRRGGPW